MRLCAKAEGTTYKIGVLQLVQHTALDAANDGFIAALDDAGIVYEVDQQNASGDQSACQTVASKFANEKKDLILSPLRLHRPWWARWRIRLS